jgi:hypothetical protein
LRSDDEKVGFSPSPMLMRAFQGMLTSVSSLGDAQRAVEAARALLRLRIEQRDALIRQELAAGMTERDVAEQVRLAPSLVHRAAASSSK